MTWESEARLTINELKQKGKWFNEWLNSLEYDKLMHIKQGEMAKCRDTWEEGYQRGREYEQRSNGVR